MTRGLEELAHTRLKLYKRTLSSKSTEADIANYKLHRNLYNKMKCTLMRDYYATKCMEIKENSKNLWSLITTQSAK